MRIQLSNTSQLKNHRTRLQKLETNQSPLLVGYEYLRWPAIKQGPKKILNKNTHRIKEYSDKNF